MSGRSYRAPPKAPTDGTLPASFDVTRFDPDAAAAEAARTMGLGTPGRRPGVHSPIGRGAPKMAFGKESYDMGKPAPSPAGKSYSEMLNESVAMAKNIKSD